MLLCGEDKSMFDSLPKCDKQCEKIFECRHQCSKDCHFPDPCPSYCLQLPCRVKNNTIPPEYNMAGNSADGENWDDEPTPGFVRRVSAYDNNWVARNPK